MLAADYPFLDVFWTMLVFFLWIAWFIILFRVLMDLFRRHDVSGLGKTAWIIFVILLPFLGVFIYIITQRDMKDAQAAQSQFDDYVKTVAASSGPAAEIEKAKALLDAGSITQAEFDAIKAKALGS
jgi:preprotein translocase subunit YajC